MKYTGGCHCGKVKYEVEMDLGKPFSCNCSICQMKGTLLSMAEAGKFNLLKGKESLTDYQFYKKNIHHFFCSTCGVTSFARGTGPNGQEMYAINVRCLEGIDLEKIEFAKVDGRSF